MTDKPVPELGSPGKIAILGLGIMPAIGTGTISVMLPAIADAFGRGPNDIQIKMVSTALGLGMFVGAPFGGFLLDHLGRRRTLLISALVFGILGCAIMMMKDLWPIIIARFFIGLAAGTIGVGTAAVIGDYFQDDKRSRWLGYSGAVASGFTVIVNPFVGMLTDRAWQLGFALYAIAFPIALAIFLGISAQRNTQSVSGQTSYVLPRKEIPWNALLLASILGTLAVGTSLYWPFRLRELGVTKSADIALYGLPNIIGIFIFALLYGWLRRRLTVENVFILSALLSALGLAMIALAPTPEFAMLGLGIEGAGIGMMTPNLSTYALAITPLTYRGRVLGLVKAAVYGSPFFTQFLLLPLSNFGGSIMALMGISVMSLVMALGVFQGWIGRIPANSAN